MTHIDDHANKAVHEAAKKFHEALLALGYLNPSVLYSYSMEDEEGELIQIGYLGYANDAIATGERVKHLIIQNERDDDSSRF